MTSSTAAGPSSAWIRRAMSVARSRWVVRSRQDVGAGGRGGCHPFAQLVEERGDDRSRGLRGRSGGACAYEFDRIARKGPMLQPALAHEIGEPAVRGQHHLVACLLQPLTKARERRDVTARTRCHDQNPRQVPPTVLRVVESTPILTRRLNLRSVAAGPSPNGPQPDSSSTVRLPGGRCFAVRTVNKPEGAPRIVLFDTSTTTE